MTNNSNNINNLSPVNNVLQTVEINKMEAYFNQNKNAKLIVLSLDDLNEDMLKQLQSKQCLMVLLNDNFKIVEENNPNSIRHIDIAIDGCKRPVAIENITRFEACGNYTYIHLKNHPKPVLTSRTLKYYVNLLDNESFIRPHNKYLINQKYVTSFKNGNTISLADGFSITVSRRRLSHIKKILLNK